MRRTLFLTAAGTLAAVAFLPLVASSAPHESVECGLVDDAIPDFALYDVNPNSVTEGDLISRDDVLGGVLVMYFAAAT